MSRGSFSNSQPAVPYQIYNEAINTGKNLGGTKKKVRWRFGWSNEEGEHDIEFVHSMMSGKRTLFEDGREIVATSSLMSLEFSHGWTSNGHMFRVEAITGISEDSTYVFTIDGFPYTDFPHREEARRRASLDGGAGGESRYVGRYNNDLSTNSHADNGNNSYSDTNNRRTSYNNNSYGGRESFTGGSSGNTRSNDPHPPNAGKSKNSDPFANSSVSGLSGSGGFARDPFAGDPFAEDPFATSTDPFSSGPSNAMPTSKSAASSVFSSVEPSSNNSFDPFATNTNPNTNANSNTELFNNSPPQQYPSQSPASSSGFGVVPGGPVPIPVPAAAPTQQQQEANPFVSGPINDPFASRIPAAAPALVPAPAPAPAPMPDLFNTPVAASSDGQIPSTAAFDPFTSSGSSDPFGGSGSGSDPFGGGSGNEGDLMSINFTTNVQTSNLQHQSPPQQVQQFQEQVEPVATQDDVKCTVTKGINSLVDLDLGGSAVKRDAERRLSSNQGPSLTSLLGQPDKRSSGTAASIPSSTATFDPFGMPQQQMQQGGMIGMQSAQFPTATAVEGMPVNSPYPMNMSMNTNMMGSAPMNTMGGSAPGFAPPPPLATNPNMNMRSGSISTMMQPQNINLNTGYTYQDPNKQKTSLDSLGTW